MEVWWPTPGLYGCPREKADLARHHLLDWLLSAPVGHRRWTRPSGRTGPRSSRAERTLTLIAHLSGILSRVSRAAAILTYATPSRGACLYQGLSHDPSRNADIAGRNVFRSRVERGCRPRGAYAGCTVNLSGGGTRRSQRGRPLRAASRTNKEPGKLWPASGRNFRRLTKTDAVR
jgi:hypothetical protein